LAWALSRATQMNVEAETLKITLIFCGIGLFVSLLFACWIFLADTRHNEWVPQMWSIGRRAQAIAQSRKVGSASRACAAAPLTSCEIENSSGLPLLPHSPKRRGRKSAERLGLISAQRLCLYREGKPLHTFPDHAPRAQAAGDIITSSLLLIAWSLLFSDNAVSRRKNAVVYRARFSDETRPLELWFWDKSNDFGHECSRLEFAGWEANIVPNRAEPQKGRQMVRNTPNDFADLALAAWCGWISTLRAHGPLNLWLRAFAKQHGLVAIFVETKLALIERPLSAATPLRDQPPQFRRMVWSDEIIFREWWNRPETGAPILSH
jgi:hypothetical protein